MRRSHGHPLPGALGCVENQRIARADLHKRRENQQVCNQLGKHNFILILDVCMLFHMICVVSHRLLSCQVYYSMLQLPRQEFDESVALLLSSCSARPAACLFLLGPSSGLELKENHPDVWTSDITILLLLVNGWMSWRNEYYKSNGVNDSCS